MNVSNVRVFTTEAVIRLGLQNAVVRKLRRLGCRVLSTSLDSMLTISLDQPVPPMLLRQRGGWSKRQTNNGRLVTIEVDGCLVVWMEGQPC